MYPRFLGRLQNPQLWTLTPGLNPFTRILYLNDIVGKTGPFGRKGEEECAYDTPLPSLATGL